MSSPSAPDEPAPRSGPRTLLRLALALAIVVAGAAAYLPSLPGEFLWNDDDYVTHNPTLHDAQGLRDIWIPRFEPRYEPHTPQYYPLTFTVLWIEYQLFGVDPEGYRLVNLALHLLNALLVWAVFARLGMRGAWLVGALFALHPVHVETTAWAMEMKNLLSGAFYLLAALAYLRFDALRSSREEGRSPAGWYALAMLLFVGALLSKSVTCTLPAALCLAFLFRRERLDARRLAPLVPMVLVGVSLAANTAFLEHAHVGAEGEDFAYSPAERVLIASRVMLFYPLKLLVPRPLLFVYPRWEIDPGSLLAWWPVAVLLAVAALAILAYARGLRGPALGLAFFAGSILPASGIVTFYPMLFSFVADHFVYLPSLGILALVAAAIERGLRPPAARAGVAAAALAALWVLTWNRSAEFATAEALYRHTLAHNPDAWLARTQLAHVLMPGGQPWKGAEAARPDPERLREAEAILREAIEREPDHAMPRYNLALCLHHLERNDEALPYAERAAELLPRDPELAAVAGVLRFATGDVPRAKEWALRALAEDPGNFKANLLLGDCAWTERRAEEAARAYLRALDAAPIATARAAVQQKLLMALGRTPPATALTLLEAALAARGSLPFGLDRVRAQALASVGRSDEAIRLTEELLERVDDPAVAEGLRQQLELIRRRAATTAQ